MAALWSLIVGLFWLLFIVVAVLVVFALKGYNRLRGLKETVHEKLSNVEAAINKRTTEVNQLHALLSQQKDWEGSIQVTIARDSSASGLMAAYQQSSSMLATLQGVADRFPDLKSNNQFLQVGETIRACEADVQGKVEIYNSAVKSYNTACGSIPTVLYAPYIGYPRADLFNLDTTGGAKMRELKTDDGEALRELLSGARSQVAGATRVLAGHAQQAGKLIATQAGQASRVLAEKIKDHATPRYFYMTPGGVPQGPASIDEIRSLVAQGALAREVMLAEAGSQEWKPIAAVEVQWDEGARDA